MAGPKRIHTYKELMFYKRREPALRILAGLGLFLSVVLLVLQFRT
jgi:hypothetical protein